MDQAQIKQKLERVDEILHGLEGRLQKLEAKEEVPTRKQLMERVQNSIIIINDLENFIKEAGLEVPPRRVN